MKTVNCLVYTTTVQCVHLKVGSGATTPISELLLFLLLIGSAKQGIEPFNFSGSGWVQQRFQISVQFRLRFK